MGQETHGLAKLFIDNFSVFFSLFIISIVSEKPPRGVDNKIVDNKICIVLYCIKQFFNVFISLTHSFMRVTKAVLISKMIR